MALRSTEVDAQLDPEMHRKLNELDRTARTMAGQIYELAFDACNNRDPELVYNLVSQSRRMTQFARTLARNMGVEP